MKKTQLLQCSLFLLISSSSIAQNHEFLDIGNIRAMVSSDGLLFNNRTLGTASFEAPKGSDINAIYSSSLMLTASSIRNGNQHYSYVIDRPGTIQSFRTGPVDIIHQVGDTSSQFNRIWKISKAAIDAHILNWSTTNYVIPSSIIDWPGNGALNTAQKLAPFADLDNDGLYEPQNGEYPLIKGDQAIFYIANDFRQGWHSFQLNPNNSNDTLYDFYDNPMRIEIHGMIYAYNSSSVAANNSIFVHLKIHNRSNSNLDNHNNLKLSVAADFDLGNFADDYVGTDSLRNMFYAYNGDLHDKSNTFSNGYEHKLAAVGVKFLDNSIEHSVHYDHTSGPTSELDDPRTMSNYQNGLWKNNQPIYYGGNAFDFCIDTTIRTKLVYSGNPTLFSDTTQWVESNPCLNGNTVPNTPGDRRIYGGPSISPQLNIGQSTEIDYVYIFARDKDSSSHISDPVQDLFNAADSVQAFYDRERFVGISEQKVKNQLDFKIYPNPAKETITIETDLRVFDVEIINLQGQSIQQEKDTKTLTISHLSCGIYFLKLLGESGSGVRRLVVSH